MSLEKLDTKVDELVNENKTKKHEESDVAKAIEEVKLNIKNLQRKVCNIEKNILKKLKYIDAKQDNLLELLQQKSVNIEELQRQKEIEELERRLRELKGV